MPVASDVIFFPRLPEPKAISSNSNNTRTKENNFVVSPVLKCVCIIYKLLLYELDTSKLSRKRIKSLFAKGAQN